MLVYHHMADVRLVGNTSGMLPVELQTGDYTVSYERRAHTTICKLAQSATAGIPHADRR